MLSIRSVQWYRKKRNPSMALQTGPIVDAFREYIHNELPPRLIDTSRLQFVSRNDVFRVFQNEIASVTEGQIQERIRSFQSDPFATYQPRRETVLRQIIQEIIRYDILSHRWNEIAGEPTFQDLSGGKRYATWSKKLVQFCRTSKNLGFKLAWIDTCCIDKTNASEVSEAIHAMYKWYANAYLCLAYLAESTTYAEWTADSWFTRGWTLQELLAPRRVKFYNKNWESFIAPEIEDHRQSEEIIYRLEKITGIAKAVLAADNSQGVEGHSLWEIMSWASKRQTTRTEDRAYCLVGLFRVSLTISYGEGQRAFTRLVEAVSAKNPTWDVFAWSGQPSVYHFALPSSPASYSPFETCIWRDRIGIREFTITTYGLALKSLPLVPMEVSSVVNPEEPGKPYFVKLKPRHGDGNPLEMYGDLVVECGSTRLKIICSARQLSACIINYHATRSRGQGKLMVGEEYICFLLYSEDEEDEERTWIKLTTDNLLRISCRGVSDAPIGDTFIQPSDSVVSSLVITFIRSPAIALSK